MTVYELATLTFKPRLGAPPFPGLLDYLAGDPDGVLAGVWMPEISRQNTVLVLRGFPDHASLGQARARVLASDDPFGCVSELNDLSVETFVPFPGYDVLPPGAYGPYYEFRTYIVPPAGIAPTIDAWVEKIPERAPVSAPTAVMYAFDGRPRFLHIWAFHSLRAREDQRTRVFGEGMWPPTSAPRWLTSDMRSEIFLPADISPLK